MIKRTQDMLKLSALCLTALALLLIVGLGGTYLVNHVGYGMVQTNDNSAVESPRSWEA